MDPDKRIEELEAQVRRLNAVVQEFLQNKGGERAVSKPDRSGAARELESALVENMRRRVDRALGGNEEASIESRIGAVWLSRAAVVVLMTAIALAARTTFTTDAIGPLEKALIGYGMAVVFTVYGLWFGRRDDLFAQAVLGCGLAGFYFVSYAVFFIQATRIERLEAALGSAESFVGLPLILLCLIFLAAVAHWRRSETVAGIGLFLAYYTVVVSCTQEPTLESLAHALLTCTVLAFVTLLFHLAHRWLLFSWAALIATHATYLYFFVKQPEGLNLPDHVYFWISNGFLTICFLLFSITCILDARKTGEYRRTVAPMSGVNSAVFLVLTWFAVREQYPAEQWMFRSAAAALFLLFAVFAETTGPRRNYLFQIFIAKAVIMATLALQAYLSDSGEKLMVAMSVECLALGFSYKRSGIVIFKVLGLLLMIITFVGSLASVKMPGVVHFGPTAIPANWFCAIGVTFFFQIVAWFYERFVRRVAPEHRKTSGQWFMADSMLDLRGASMAVLHAAAGALLLLTITILQQGDNVLLPYLLAGEGLLMAALGVLLRTPQIEVAGVLLLAAAHVCFYVFLALPVPGFEQQDRFALLTVLLALFTYMGAHAWERYLRRYRYGGADWEHHVVAALPYLAATVMLTTLMGRQLDALHVPAAQGALGMALLLAGSISGYSGVRASGVMAAGLSAVSYYVGLYNPEAPLARMPEFPLFLGLFLATLVASERLIALLEWQDKTASRLDDVLRTALVALLGIMGGLGLYEWSPKSDFLFYLLGLAVVAIILGAVFRESRYRWAALLLFVIILTWAFARFADLSPVYQVLTFGASAIVLMVVSWAYSHSHRKAAALRAADTRADADSDGAANSEGAVSKDG